MLIKCNTPGVLVNVMVGLETCVLGNDFLDLAILLRTENLSTSNNVRLMTTGTHTHTHMHAHRHSHMHT